MILQEKVAFVRPLLPFGAVGEASAHCTHCTHLQIKQADEKTKFAKESNRLKGAHEHLWNLKIW